MTSAIEYKDSSKGKDPKSEDRPSFHDFSHKDQSTLTEWITNGYRAIQKCAFDLFSDLLFSAKSGSVWIDFDETRAPFVIIHYNSSSYFVSLLMSRLRILYGLTRYDFNIAGFADLNQLFRRNSDRGWVDELLDVKGSYWVVFARRFVRDIHLYGFDKIKFEYEPTAREDAINQCLKYAESMTLQERLNHKRKKKNFF